jgi:hypothetical protein
MRKLIIGSLIVAAVGFSFPAAARTNVDFFVNVAPPPARYEVVPAARPGWFWVPGAWEWRSNRHHWARGHWVRERHGYYYAPTRWEERDGRHYYYGGGWRRGDRDGDGVPNRYDRAPDNPYRR